MRETIAPILRGALWDGRSRKFVVFSEREAPSREDVLLLDRAIATTGERLEESLVEALVAFEKRNSAPPRAFYLPGVGTFGVGESYELALQRSEGKIDAEAFLPAEARSRVAKRAAVMEGRIAVVTGGAQGFGAEIVRGLVEGGAVVVVADLNVDGAVAYARSLNEEFGRTVALAMGVDVSSEESVGKLLSSVVSRLGGLDLFVSNAGVLKAGSVKELTLKEFTFVTSVNYIGFFLCTKHASPVMAAQSRGATLADRPPLQSDIIQINSKSGLEGSKKNGAYAGGKFGGIGLVQSFALELVEDRIKVNAICPGNFFDGPLWSDPKTGLFVQYLEAEKVPGAKSIGDVKRFYEAKVPMGRGCEGDDVIRAIYYVVEQEYETGQAIPVTGGQVMLS
ncbi:MAG: SDR family NAD(P)-dependent oxidoreductase [Spirochaetaceae bacterium]